MKNLLLPGLLATFSAGLCWFGATPLLSQTTPASAPEVQSTPLPEMKSKAAPPQKNTSAKPAAASGKQVELAPLPESPAAVPNENRSAADAGQAVSEPAANTSGTKPRRAPYVIGPEDVLMIKVWQEANLSGEVTVGPDGMISLQLIDEVKADGLTPEQLKGVLTDRLKSFIVNPDVNVQVRRVNSRKFIIQGEVTRPGSFPLTGPTTVMEALVSGGGFREFANPKKIYILRTEVNPQTKKPETKKLKFNYKDVSNGKNMEQNILIQNGDQIFVP